MNQPTLIRHKPCGFIWKVRPSDLLYKKSSNCPRCRTNESQGSKTIEKYLIEKDFTYIKEYTLLPTKLRLDFYIEYKGRRIGIEYNGRQHYEYTPYFHQSLDAFYNQQLRDIKKQEYCDINQIILLVIPYTLYPREIIEYLDRFFQKAQRLKQEKPLKKVPYPRGR